MHSINDSVIYHKTIVLLVDRLFWVGRKVFLLRFLGKNLCTVYSQEFKINNYKWEMQERKNFSVGKITRDFKHCI
jgi:hypothetical protein